MEIDAIPSGFRVRRRHLIGEQRIDVAVSPDLARPALLDRIGELNRSRFLPLIERLFDEVDRPGELIRIDRLSIDLGRFDGDDLEGVEARLAQALRRALGEALGNARRRPAGAIGRGDGAERVGLGVALVEAFEHYLLHGAWPYGAGMDPGARPAACLAQLIAEEPAALVAMLRRRGPADPLLRRLVRQMPEAELRALLHRLEPAHAAYVLSYLDEVRASHEVEPVVPATREELDETLWTIVLRDALQKAGLQANRKAFLRRLLAQLEAAHGVPAGSLVLQLRRGLKGVRGRRREPGSLVEILAELLAEDIGLIARPLLMAELAALLGGAGPANADGRAELRQLLGLALRGHRTELGWLLRRLAETDEPKLAARLPPALPLDVTLGQLLDTGPALRGRSKGGPARLLETGPAPRGRARRGRAPSDTPLAALARLLDLPAAATTAGSREDMRLLMRLLDEAGAGDA
ncbi:MAG TPA: contractile injection system tape measure protein, partial [Allosphingosinicella sp.]